MPALKTKPSAENIHEFIASIEDEQKRKDCKSLLKIMNEITNEKPKLWGSGMVGFGKYHYKYASGHEGDSFLTGFSPRKQNITLFIMSGLDQHDTLLKKLGKFKTAKSCLYIKKMEDVDLAVLKSIIKSSVELISLKRHACVKMIPASR